MGQNNDTTEHGDKQGQQGGQIDRSGIPQESQRQQQKLGQQENNNTGDKNTDKTANQGSSNANDNKNK